jgi:hypothetical protein
MNWPEGRIRLAARKSSRVPSSPPPKERRLWNIRSVAGGAHLGISLLETGRVETWSMGIEPSSTPGGVTGEAVPLGVTAYTGLQALPGCLTMTDEEKPLGIMESRPQGPFRHQPRLLVAGRTERGWAVAVSAGTLPGIGCRWVAGKETHRMVPAR